MYLYRVPYCRLMTSTRLMRSTPSSTASTNRTDTPMSPGSSRRVAEPGAASETRREWWPGPWPSTRCRPGGSTSWDRRTASTWQRAEGSGSSGRWWSTWLWGYSGSTTTTTTHTTSSKRIVATTALLLYLFHVTSQNIYDFIHVFLYFIDIATPAFLCLSFVKMQPLHIILLCPLNCATNCHN